LKTGRDTMDVHTQDFAFAQPDNLVSSSSSNNNSKQLLLLLGVLLLLLYLLELL